MTIPGNAPGRAPGRTFLALGIGEMVARAIVFGATVFMARRLGAAGYGVVALAGAILLYCSHLADLGIDTLGVAEVARRESSIPRLVPSLVLARTLMALALWALLVVVGLGVMTQPEGAILAAFGAMLLFRATNIKWALIAVHKPEWVAVSRALGELVQAIIILAVVRNIGDVVSVPAAQVAGDAVAALLLVVVLGRLGWALPVAWSAEEAGPVLRAALPLVAHALLALLVFNSDLILLRVFRDSTTVGFYAAAYTLVSFLSNLGVSFGTALLPAHARYADGDPERDRLFDTSLAQAAALTLPLAAGGMLVADGLIALVFGPGYGASVAPLRILLWSVPPVWLRVATQMALVARGRQRDVLVVTAIGAVLTVVLDLLVIPRWGMVGAAWVTLAMELLRVGLSLIQARRAGMPWPGVARFVRPAAATLVMALVVGRLGGWPVLAAVAAGGVVYGAVLVLTGVIRIHARALPEVRL